MSTVPDLSEADILSEVVAPEDGNLTSETARAILALRFREPALQRMRDLLLRNNQGKLSDSEQLLLEKYRRVGMFLDLLQAKARLSLSGQKS